MKANTTLYIGLFLTFLAFNGPLSAQNDLYNDGGILWMGSGSLLQVEGSVYNAAGSIQNEGTLRVSGDWHNDADLIAGTGGKTVFFGTGLSTLSGDLTGTNAFSMLEIHKSLSSPSPVVVLDSDAEVSGTLHFVSGRVRTGLNEISLTDSSLTAISGFEYPGAGGVTTSTDKYIEGRLRRATGQSGIYAFPVGDAPAPAGKGYQLASVNLQAANGTSAILMGYNDSITPLIPSNPLSTDCGAELTGSLSGIWNLRPLGGSPNFDLSLYPRDFTQSGGSAPDRFFIIQSASTGGTYSPAGDSCMGEVVLLSGQEIDGTGLSSGGVYGIGTGELIPACFSDSYEPNNSMAAAKNLFGGIFSGPAKTLICGREDVDWFFLTVPSGKTIRIRLESLPDDYQLELYFGGFMVAGSFNTGTSDEFISYPAAAGGTYYVKVYGKDLAYHPSDPYNLIVQTVSKAPTGGVAIKPLISSPIFREASLGYLALYPNPAVSEVHLEWSNPEREAAVIRIFDAKGAQIYERPVMADSELAVLDIDVRQFPEGTYMVQLIANSQSLSEKLVVLRE
jgi:hypothetical protein